MSENAHAQTAAKKVAGVVLLTLAPEVEKKTIDWKGHLVGKDYVVAGNMHASL